MLTEGRLAVDIGGTTYRLVLDINAICELEDLLSTPTKDVTFEEVFQKAGKGSVRHQRAIIWASLRRHHPEVSLVRAGELILEAGGLEAFTSQVAALAASATPAPEDVKANISKIPRKAQAG